MAAGPTTTAALLRFLFLSVCVLALVCLIPSAFDQKTFLSESFRTQASMGVQIDLPTTKQLRSTTTKTDNDDASKGDFGVGDGGETIQSPPIKSALSLPSNQRQMTRDSELSPSKQDPSSPTAETSMTMPLRGKTLSIVYPPGIVGGYRNQAMRFVGLLRKALEDGFDYVLLPTLVFSTRYARNEAQMAQLEINKHVPAWPIPFDELFDVDHWNSFHQPIHRRESLSDENQTTPGSKENTTTFSLPRLVSHVVDDPENNKNRSECWKSSVDSSILSVSAIQKSNPNFTKSILPLLTQRMLFGDEAHGGPSRQTFVAEPLQNNTITYLTGGSRRMHQLNLMPSVEHCSHPHFFGGKSAVLWNSFLSIGSLLGKNKLDAAEQIKANQYKTLIEKADEALVPAKPWRQLADQCVEHHLGLGKDEFIREEEDPHARGHDHGYIALHARVEPEMLDHRCGAEMEQNLTKILDLTELLALDYNNGDLPPSFRERAKELHYTSPLNDEVRHTLRKNHRPLKGTMVAIARDELDDSNSYKKFQEITSHNRNTLNQRSISYGGDGRELYSTSLKAKDGPQQTVKSDSTLPKDKPLPIFECGEGWVEHAFYRSESRQKKLFSPASTSDAQKNYGLYHKYGPQRDETIGGPVFPLLPLPGHYFGDLLPSMLNFWLAVRADVFVGVQKSSWSNDVWTTRYYMGKGDRNFEYTTDQGILPIGNGGLPPPHKNCKAPKKKKQKR